MARFPDLTLTKAGLDLIARAQLGEKLIFTKIQLGEGQLGSNNIPDLKALIQPKLDAQIRSKGKVENGHIQADFICDNGKLAEGFFVRELGVIAKIDGETEVLYAYTNAGNYTNYMPDKTRPLDAVIGRVDIVVGNVANLEIKVDESVLYTTQKQLREFVHTLDKDGNAIDCGFCVKLID